MNKFVEQIADYLLEDNFFKNFKLQKKDSSLINKDKAGFKKVELQNWVSNSSADGELIIHPIYSVRFDVLHVWFEKFSAKKLSDQRDSYSIGFDGSMIGEKNEYTLSVNDDFESIIEELKKDVVSNSVLLFDKFQNLTDLYEYSVKPTLSNGKQLPDVGVDWVFEYLMLTKIVDPQNYSNFKDKVLNHIEHMKKKGEPNISLYYEKIDEILSFIDN